MKRVWSFGEEKIEISAFNFVYLNFANHPLGYPFNLSFENRELVNTVGGDTSAFQRPLSDYLTPSNTPKLFDLMSSLEEDSGQEPGLEPSSAVKMIQMLETQMYHESDEILSLSLPAEALNSLPEEARERFSGKPEKLALEPDGHDIQRLEQDLAIKHDGNVIPMVSQHYILGLMKPPMYTLVNNRLVIKNKVEYSKWLDSILYTVFFDL